MSEPMQSRTIRSQPRTAFDLSLGFDTLTLRSEVNSRISKFTLFTSLPIELRLKVIQHALPTHRTFQLRADVLVADPDFGLYIIFRVAPPVIDDGPVSLFGGGLTVAPRGWYTEARSLDLLLVNKEIRDYYIENFPLSLPTSGTMLDRGAGLIRYSAEESIEINNFRQFVLDPDFRKATAENWRLQKFFNEVEILHVPLDCGLSESVQMLKCFRSLKLVKGTLWKSFEGVGDGVQQMFTASMKRRMAEIEEELQKWKREYDGSYKVPKFV